MHTHVRAAQVTMPTVEWLMVTQKSYTFFSFFVHLFVFPVPIPMLITCLCTLYDVAQALLFIALSRSRESSGQLTLACTHTFRPQCIAFFFSVVASRKRNLPIRRFCCVRAPFSVYVHVCTLWNLSSTISVRLYSELYSASCLCLQFPIISVPILKICFGSLKRFDDSRKSMKF